MTRATVSRNLGLWLRESLGSHSAWIIRNRPKLDLCGDVLIPDLAAWRCSRMPASSAIAPDWICETFMTSPTHHGDVLKMSKYRDGGVEFAWIIDPHTQRLKTYYYRRGRWILDGQFGGKMTARPFDALSLDVSRLFYPEGKRARNR